jgi:hypothetical protein
MSAIDLTLTVLRYALCEALRLRGTLRTDWRNDKEVGSK